MGQVVCEVVKNDGKGVIPSGSSSTVNHRTPRKKQKERDRKREKLRPR